MTAAIETFGLTKIYGSTGVLVDLDLEVKAGQCFGFLGPSGAAKTTTIRLLLALHCPTRGRAVVLGRDSERESPDIHRHAGNLPGTWRCIPD